MRLLSTDEVIEYRNVIRKFENRRISLNRKYVYRDISTNKFNKKLNEIKEEEYLFVQSSGVVFFHGNFFEKTI